MWKTLLEGALGSQTHRQIFNLDSSLPINLFFVLQEGLATLLRMIGSPSRPISTSESWVSPPSKFIESGTNGLMELVGLVLVRATSPTKDYWIHVGYSGLSTSIRRGGCKRSYHFFLILLAMNRSTIAPTTAVIRDPIKPFADDPSRPKRNPPTRAPITPRTSGLCLQGSGRTRSQLPSLLHLLIYQIVFSSCL